MRTLATSFPRTSTDFSQLLPVVREAFTAMSQFQRGHINFETTSFTQTQAILTKLGLTRYQDPSDLRASITNIPSLLEGQFRPQSFDEIAELILGALRTGPELPLADKIKGNNNYQTFALRLQQAVTQLAQREAQTSDYPTNPAIAAALAARPQTQSLRIPQIYEADDSYFIDGYRFKKIKTEDFADKARGMTIIVNNWPAICLAITCYMNESGSVPEYADLRKIIDEINSRSNLISTAKTPGDFVFKRLRKHGLTCDNNQGGNIIKGPRNKARDLVLRHINDISKMAQETQPDSSAKTLSDKGATDFPGCYVKQFDIDTSSRKSSQVTELLQPIKKIQTNWRKICMEHYQLEEIPNKQDLIGLVETIIRRKLPDSFPISYLASHGLCYKKP